MAIFNRVKGICLKPKTEWDAISGESPSTAELFKGYAVPLAAIGPIAAFIGGSMGGMQALEWGIAFPEAVAAVIPIASTARHSAMQIAFNEIGRHATAQCSGKRNRRVIR